MGDVPPVDLRQVIDPQASVRLHPSPEASLETEALKGERVIVHESTPEGWCRATLTGDGCTGWLAANALAAPSAPLTHKVAVPRTLMFPGPSIKLPPLEALSLGCALAVARIDGPFAVTPTGGHVPARHVVPLDTFASDPVAVAEDFLNVPYLWGGKTSLGLDCSGLVQVALTACGIPCPRNSKDQEQALGVALAPTRDWNDLDRCDLLFWSGHVAMVRDRATLIHANAFHMAVALEPVDAAIARIAASGSALTSIRRLPARPGPAAAAIEK